MPGPDRLAQLDVVDHARRKRQCARSQPVDRRGLLLEVELDEVGLEAARRIGQDEETAGQLAGA